MRRKQPFWTVERLNQLRATLDRAAEHDAYGAYFGAYSLSAYVAKTMGIRPSEAEQGLNILTFLDILAPGKRGSKTAGSNYRRRYYADAPSITEADRVRFWRRLPK